MADVPNLSGSVASAKALGFKLVRCPECLGVLPEPPDVTVYSCGGCGTTLRARADFRLIEQTLQDPCAVPLCLPISFLTSITRNFSVEQELGRGGYGVVYKGICRNGKAIAVKKLFQMHIDEDDDQFHKEVITSLLNLKHRNTVQLIGYCAESLYVRIQIRGEYVMAKERQRLLCFEYLSNMSLRDHISDVREDQKPHLNLINHWMVLNPDLPTKGKRLITIDYINYTSCGLEWNMRHELIQGICCGLHYLHTESHIIHLDLKPTNILMDHCMVPKIADFGLSRFFSDQQSRVITATIRGTLGYMAPEYINNGLISYKADIFSLGVIIIELMTGARDYPNPHCSSCEACSTLYFIENVVANWRKRFETKAMDKPLLEKYIEQVKRCTMIGLMCVNPDPNKRPAAGDVMDMINAGGGSTSCSEVN